MPSPASLPAAEFQRNALAPGILGAVVLLAGIALFESDFFLVVRFIVAILALVIGWFALQARQWWWVPVMIVMAIIWNPVYPIAFDGPWWVAAHVAGAAVFIAAGATIKSPRKVTGEK
ncbi:DUF6804 family protein [Microbacterium sp. P06]|uniref:DUF6804 family protein n=1 Tax=Microbacterium sp. P06 TaxID=3366949 RepID=UPI0037458B3D